MAKHPTKSAGTGRTDGANARRSGSLQRSLLSLSGPVPPVKSSTAPKKKKKQAALEAAEAAKLKTVRQYADGVFMPAKEMTLSENGRASYRMFLNKHIFPVLGNLLLIDITPAMVQKLLLDFQKAGYAHATAVKLYNILNGVFQMAFMDDSVPVNPMLKVKRPAPRKDEAPPKEESEKAYTVQELSCILSAVAHEPLKWQAYSTSPPTAERVEANCAASNGLI